MVGKISYLLCLNEKYETMDSCFNGIAHAGNSAARNNYRP